MIQVPQLGFPYYFSQPHIHCINKPLGALKNPDAQAEAHISGT